MEEKFWYLKHCDLFERLGESQIRELESQSRMRTFKRGDLIYLPNDRSDSMLLIASGRVKIYHITGEGKQALLAIMEPHEVFGELSVFGGGQREEFAEAMEPASVILIPGPQIQQMMQELPTVALEISRLMGLRRQRYERRLKSLLFRSNRDRLVHQLLELCEKYGRPTTEGVLLEIRLSHQELANMIGSTRETVTVLLGELQSEGRLSINRRRITLHNLEQMAHSIDVPPPHLNRQADLGTRLIRQAQAEG